MNPGILLGTIGVSGLLGYAVGLLAKKISHLILILAAILFIAVQVAAAQGWITVHWAMLERLQLSAKEPLQRAGQVLIYTLSHGLPSAAAFIAGAYKAWR